MKKTLIKLMFAITALCLVGTVWSCTDDDKDDAEQVEPEPEPEPEPDPEPEPEPEPEEPWDPAGEDGVVKILSIGNSFAVDGLEEYLYSLFNAEKIEVIIADLYIGRSALEDHYNNAVSNTASYSYRKIVGGVRNVTESTTMLEGILDEDWDFISLMQSGALGGLPNTYEPYLTYLINYVMDNATNKDMQLIFHMPWAYPQDTDEPDLKDSYYNNQMYMYTTIADCYKQSMADHADEFSFLVPVGTAVQNARNTYMGDTFNRDGLHLENNYGRFLASCTWFETITHIEASTSPYTPSTVTAEQKDLVTYAVHAAILNPYQVDPMEDYQ